MKKLFIIQAGCEGDSGGPIYINEQIEESTGDLTGRTLAGTFSGSGTNACGNLNIPGYYQRISEFLPWIKCVKKHAELNKTTRNVERACNQFVIRATSFECPTKE